MNDERTSSSSHSMLQRTQHALTISDLPDEMLNSIIKELGDTYDFRLRLPPGNVDHGSWHSCALVCHRWHAITLPHLYRCIQLPETYKGVEDYLVVVPRFLHFLEENPTIARFIQCLVMYDLSGPVNLDDFHRIVGCLPGLCHLTVSRTYFERYDDAHVVNEGLPEGERNLRMLSYDAGSSEVLEFLEGYNPANVLTAIAAPFSTIDRIALAGAVFGIKEDALEFPVFSHRQVHEVNVTSRLEGLGPRLPQYLHDIGLLSYLTCLIVPLWLRGPVETMRTEMVGQLLQLSSKTLRELHIGFDVFSCESNEISGRSTVLKPLRAGLEACTLLHGLHLSISDHFSPSIRTHTSYRSQLSTTWSLGLEIVSWMSNSTLAHLSYIFETRYESLNFCSDVLSESDWSRLREITGRFAHARSITIDVRLQLHYFCVQSHKPVADYIRSKLPNLGDVLRVSNSTGDGRCSDMDCVWGRTWPGADNSKVV